MNRAYVSSQSKYSEMCFTGNKENEGRACPPDGNPSFTRSGLILLGETPCKLRTLSYQHFSRDKVAKGTANRPMTPVLFTT